MDDLPEYSAELLAANYPSRVDPTILSGPYTPVYIAREQIAKARNGTGDSLLKAARHFCDEYRREFRSPNEGGLWVDGFDSTSPVDAAYLALIQEIGEAVSGVGTVLGVDLASPNGDKSAEVRGTVDEQGNITITDVRES